MPNKDSRYDSVKALLAAGYITQWRSIFDHIPKSVVTRDMRINNIRFTVLIANLENWRLKDIFKMARLFGINEKEYLYLMYQQLLVDRKRHKKQGRSKK